MTPYSLNPPGGPSIQAGQTQQQLFNISPNNQDCRTFFNIFDPIGGFRENYQQDESNKMVLLHDGSSSSNCNSSSSFNISPEEDHGCSSTRNKWMSSKMRLMKKMMRPPTTDKPINSTPRFQNQRSTPRNNNNASTATTRVCSDCNTTTTPLWRSGPMGPKSLCNACGIRQRKARRAMAEAAKGLVTAPLNNATKIRVHNKELKKSRSSNHFSQFKNKYKSTTTTTTSHHEGSVRKLEYFKDFSIRLRSTNSSDFHQQEVFPRDEVAEAALLLMDLSCGILSTFN